MQDFIPEKPCLVETGRGFSVSYKNRLLYSKYDPKKSVLRAVSDFQMLPGTLVLALSPALWYGLDELSEKAGGDSFILAIETDSQLYELSRDALKKIGAKKNVAFLPHSEINNIVELISGTRTSEHMTLPPPGSFKRARSIEMSGGVGLDRDFYAAIASACEDAVASFWKNRITLTRMGKLYSTNVFKNLARLGKSSGAAPSVSTIASHTKSVAKPILVVGAGESAEATLKALCAYGREGFFVLCVDAAVPLLSSLAIVPDGVVALESQLAIEKAYIGGGAKKSIIFADISSREEVTHHTSTEVSYFATRFAPARFFDQLSQKPFFPPTVPPLGSVGLTATLLALRLRKNDDIPVVVTGLDFSFSLGKTHANGTYPHINRLSSSGRLFPAENYDAAFKKSASSFTGKDGKRTFTDKALYSYALMFAHTFRGTKNLFDIAPSGTDLAIARATAEEAIALAKSGGKGGAAAQNKESVDFNKEITDYLEGEEKTLNRIKELLMFGKDVAKCGVSVEAELESLVSCREYLFLHFPDGFKCAVHDLSFLKRVRVEVDFFLKTITRALKAVRTA
ncbi:MAG: DUF115 domain-containing protein [Treponema sp.]|nr:DUF115 domain-containing protein [Treponema sp.]